MNEKKSRQKEATEIARFTSVGIGLVVSMLIGYYAGITIDKHTHTAPLFTLIFLLLGIGAGMLNVFRTLGKNSN
jgi:ATP synthase protein I